MGLNCLSASMLSLALECCGSEKILWGSDFPAQKDLSKSIEAINALDINEKEKENILSGNIMSLF